VQICGAKSVVLIKFVSRRSVFASIVMDALLKRALLRRTGVHFCTLAVVLVSPGRGYVCKAVVFTAENPSL
jgi:hypothetical protein